MSGIFQNLLKGAAEGLFGSDYLRDYTHASKTFRTNSYQNAPKLKFLFHTYFEINPDAWKWQNIDLSDINRTNFGLIVKNINLPSYTFSVDTMNQYNRKRVIQTKLRYEPITITFHDDHANNATRLWEGYYRYYYGDGSRPGSIFSGSRGNQSSGDTEYNTRDTYSDNWRGKNWGYMGDSSKSNGVKIPFFKNITVFGLSQHNFTAYTLINPIITQFRHDNYDYDSGNGVMQNQMTIDYETVVYNYGSLDGRDAQNIVKGFGQDENYDRRISPISKPGANGAILGPGGLLDGVGGTLEALGGGNYLSAIVSAGTTYNTFKDINLKETAKQELLAGVTTALTNPSTIRNVTNWVVNAAATPNSRTGSPAETPPN